jgi:hypothetical protein
VGYTHYWDMPEKMVVSKTQMKLLQEILDEHRPLLSGYDGTGEPVLTNDLISLNGIGPDDDHETFRVVMNKGERDADEWGFCKTARKPYDIVVCKMLLVLTLTKDFNIRSDGVEENPAGVRYLGDENWVEAMVWFIGKGYEQTNLKKIIPHLNKD